MVEVISGYVALKKSGQNFVGLCPFHGEKSPSFTVSSAKQLFHCFGCGVGGNLFTFLMKTEGITFPEAVRALGKRIGLSPPDTMESSREAKQRDRLRTLLQLAAGRFHDQLLTHASAAKARAYLADRQMTEATIDTFGLGYALAAWDGLMTPLIRQGWTPQELCDAGLIVRRSEGSGYYDRFRDRVIFPIRDLQGQVVGFGARVLDDGQPKYLNSPETALYSKGRLLYGLDRARAAASRTGCLVVVEGYFDAIAAHQAGLTHVVATLGTALTTAHIALLQRLAPKVVLLFDPDPAGVRATLRTVDLFLEHGLSASVATLPTGDDPDSFLHRYGTAAFEARLSAAQPLLEFAIERALACAPHDQITGKTAVVQALVPTLRKVQSRLELDHYLRLLAQRLAVSEASLRADLARSVSDAGRARPGAVPPEPRPLTTSVAAWTGEERVLLHLWVHRHIEADQLVSRLRPEEFFHPTAQALMRLIRESVESGETDPIRAVSARAAADDALAAAVAGLSLLELEYDSAEKAFEECAGKLRGRQLDEQVRQLEQARRAAEVEGNDQRVQELQTAILQSRRTLEVPPGSRIG